MSVIKCTAPASSHDVIQATVGPGRLLQANIVDRLALFCGECPIGVSVLAFSGDTEPDVGYEIMWGIRV